MKKEIFKLMSELEKKYNTILRLKKNPAWMDTDGRWVVVYANTNYRFTSASTLMALKEILKIYLE